MPTLYDYRLFISHAWDYSEAYQRIVKFIDAAPNFSYHNYSVPTDKAFIGMNKSQLQDQLARQINPVQVVVILGGMYVAHSEWIQYEISYAAALGKPILGIQPWGSERMPDALTREATKIVGWNTESIVSAIRGLVK